MIFFDSFVVLNYWIFSVIFGLSASAVLLNFYFVSLIRKMSSKVQVIAIQDPEFISLKKALEDTMEFKNFTSYLHEKVKKPTQN